jgi:transposase
MGSPDNRKQSKTLIYNVYSYLKELVASKPDATVKELFSQTQKATADVCSVSYRTVQRICAEADRNAASNVVDGTAFFESPKKGTLRKRPVTDLDDFDKCVIRRTIQEFYDRKEYPTCNNLKNCLIEKINFSGCTKSLWKILKTLGFQFKKCNDGRKFLMERNDIVASRMIFLRKMHNMRKESYPRPVIYLDETWINQNHSRQYIWQDSTSQGGLKVPIGKGSRLIICHAGSAHHGFIQSAQLVFQSKSTVDYHQEMNSEVFKEWFIDLLKGLEESSVIVMDNASYHSCYAEKFPTTKSRKADIVAWLQIKNIPHNSSNTVPELLNIVRQHKEKYKVYELDKIAYEMGHEVVRLPPYHCQYNPIELIWAQVKGEVAARNKTFKIKDVRKLLEEALCRVTVDNWKKCVEHAEKLQEEDFVKEGVRDDTIQELIINLREDSDSSYSESEDEL